MNIGKSLGSAAQKVVTAVTSEPKEQPKGIMGGAQNAVTAVTGEPKEQPKGIMGAAQNVVSAAGTQGAGEVRDTTPDQEPTREAKEQPRQAESFQERYNQDLFE